MIVFFLLPKSIEISKSDFGAFFVPFFKKGGIEMNKTKIQKGYYIFRSSRKDPKTGKIIYASQYGKKAFKIWISK